MSRAGSPASLSRIASRFNPGFGRALMRIAKLETLHANAGWRNFSFLKLTTDEGLIGWSEYVDNFGVGGGVTALIPRFAAVVTGMDPREVARISASLQGIMR